MGSKTIWNDRMKAYYYEIASYFLIIGMGVFYTFLILGSVFIYYYIKFIQWLPPTIFTELIASLLIACVLLTTRIRTFVKQADIIFLFPMEKEMTGYFRKSQLFSAFLEAIKLLLALLVLSPLIRDTITIVFMLALLVLLLLNIRLVWVEQWLESKMQLVVHRTIRFLVTSTVIYFSLIHNWIIVGSLLLINFVLFFKMFGKEARGVKWSFLIKQEQKAVMATYRFLNLYIDVPHLKHSFSRRKFLVWFVGKWIPYKESSPHMYLFSRLFSRYNEFFYLYLRLSLIGLGVVYFFPTYGWIVILLVLFVSSYQVLPLQHSINEIVRLYPISTTRAKIAFKQFLFQLSIVQLVFLNLSSIFQVNLLQSISVISVEVIGSWWFVYFFLSKRMFNEQDVTH